MIKHVSRMLLLGTAVLVLPPSLAQPTTAPKTAAVAKVEGLELLNKIGSYRGPVNSFQAVKPSEQELQAVVRLSAKLGDNARVKFGEPVRGDGSNKLWLAPADPSALFEVDARTGNFIFNGGLNRYRKDEPTPGLPTEQSAGELAQRQLANLGLKPAEGEWKVAHVGGLSLGVYDGKGKSVTYDKLRSVRYARVLGGLPVEGDSRIVVELGEAGGLASLTYKWPKLNVTKVGLEALADPQAVRGQALEVLRSVAPAATRSKLTAVDLVLYDDGKGTIEPAYHIVLQQFFPFPAGAQTMNPFDFYLPALKASRVILPKVNGAAEPAREDRASIDRPPVR